MNDTIGSGAQWVNGQLARYARLVDRRDSEGIGHLLAQAEVVFKDHAPISGAAEVTGFYQRAFTAPNTATLHLPLTPVVDEIEDALHYEAPYMRLSDPVDAPQIESTGVYRGVIDHAGSTWRFRTFRVDTH